MLKRIRSRITYGNVVATLALFVALGGTSYAVTKIGSKEIRNNSVRSKDIRNNDVRSRDIRNHSLLAKDFKGGQLPSGLRGPPGVSGYTVRRTTSAASSALKDVVATCPAGLVAVGGGGTATGAANGTVALIYSLPTDPPNRWRVGAAEVNGGTTANWTLSAYAVCARAG
jgi:hypothetical protein